MTCYAATGWYRLRPLVPSPWPAPCPCRPSPSAHNRPRPAPARCPVPVPARTVALGNATTNPRLTGCCLRPLCPCPQHSCAPVPPAPLALVRTRRPAECKFDAFLAGLGSGGRVSTFSKAMALRRLHLKSSLLGEVLYAVNLRKVSRVTRAAGRCAFRGGGAGAARPSLLLVQAGRRRASRCPGFGGPNMLLVGHHHHNGCKAKAKAVSSLDGQGSAMRPHCRPGPGPPLASHWPAHPCACRHACACPARLPAAPVPSRPARAPCRRAACTCCRPRPSPCRGQPSSSSSDRARMLQGASAACMPRHMIGGTGMRVLCLLCACLHAYVCLVLGFFGGGRGAACVRAATGVKTHKEAHAGHMAVHMRAAMHARLAAHFLWGWFLHASITYHCCTWCNRVFCNGWGAGKLCFGVRIVLETRGNSLPLSILPLAAAWRCALLAPHLCWCPVL